MSKISRRPGRQNRKKVKGPDREFHGKLKDFDSKLESVFEKAHLKAYKRGQTSFRFGKDVDDNPIYVKVKTQSDDQNE